MMRLVDEPPPQVPQTRSELTLERHRDRRARWLLAALAAALWLLLLGFAHTDLTLSRRSAQVIYFLAAFAVFASAVGLVWRLGHRASRRTVVFILFAGIFFRLSLAPIRPVTTWDVYRYIWEGEVINAGHNPFLEPPNSPALRPLRDHVWQHVEFQSVPAAYPPVAQYVFALAARVPADKVITLKLVMALFDIGTVLLLPGLLIRLRRPPVWALVYAWHPLVVGEVVARGHLDSIGIFFLVLAMYLTGRRGEDAKSRGVGGERLRVESRDSRVTAQGKTFGWALVGAALAGAVLAKGYALFAVPFFVVGAAREGDEAGTGGLRGTPPMWLLGGFALAAGLAYLPFAGAGWSVFRGLGLYSRLWHGYAPVYPVVDWVVRRFGHDHVAMTRWALAAAFTAWMLNLLRRERRGAESGRVLDGSFSALAGFFVLSPVLYSWYLAWIVPFLCLRPRPGWLLLTGTIFAFYAHEFAGAHVEFRWLNAIEYGLPLAVGLGIWLATRRSRFAKASQDLSCFARTG